MDGFVVKRITYAFFRYLCESGLLAIPNEENKMRFFGFDIANETNVRFCSWENCVRFLQIFM